MRGRQDCEIREMALLRPGRGDLLTEQFTDSTLEDCSEGTSFCGYRVNRNENRNAMNSSCFSTESIKYEGALYDQNWAVGQNVPEDPTNLGVEGQLEILATDSSETEPESERNKWNIAVE